MTDKHALIQPDRGQDAVAVHLVDKAGLEDFVKSLPPPQRAALAAQKFEAEGYSHAFLPEGDGWSVVAGVADAASLSSWCMAKLAEVLPAGFYRRAEGEPGKALFGWTPEEAIETIRADGALDVVAHPARIRDKARMDRVLEAAHGIEVYTSRHKAEVAAGFRARAEASGKHWTASADDHGHVTYIRPPDGTPRRTIDRICQGA